jgi:hypothetical protein
MKTDACLVSQRFTCRAPSLRGSIVDLSNTLSLATKTMLSDFLIEEVLENRLPASPDSTGPVQGMLMELGILQVTLQISQVPREHFAILQQQCRPNKSEVNIKYRDSPVIHNLICMCSARFELGLVHC